MRSFILIVLIYFYCNNLRRGQFCYLSIVCFNIIALNGQFCLFSLLLVLFQSIYFDFASFFPFFIFAFFNLIIFIFFSFHYFVLIGHFLLCLFSLRRFSWNCKYNFDVIFRCYMPLYFLFLLLQYLYLILHLLLFFLEVANISIEILQHLHFTFIFICF